MTTFVKFTPPLNSQVTAQLSGKQSILTSNAVVSPVFGINGLIGANSSVGQNNPKVYNNFSFQATLDGLKYNVVITWNIYSQRYYLTIYDLNNNLVLTLPLIGSPNDFDISMTKGYFNSKLIYRAQSNQFEISP